jgi:hypothetical protein
MKRRRFKLSVLASRAIALSVATAADKPQPTFDAVIQVADDDLAARLLKPNYQATWRHSCSD